MSLIPTADRLFTLLHLDPLPRPEYVERYPVEPNLNAYTKQEREWIRDETVRLATEEGRR